MICFIHVEDIFLTFGFCVIPVICECLNNGPSIYSVQFLSGSLVSLIWVYIGKALKTSILISFLALNTSWDFCYVLGLHISW